MRFPQAKDEEKKLIEQSLQKGSIEHLEQIMAIISDTKAIEYTQMLAHQEAEKAKQALEFLPSSPYKNALLPLLITVFTEIIKMTTLQAKLFLVIIAIAMFMDSMDTTILNTASQVLQKICIIIPLN